MTSGRELAVEWPKHQERVEQLEVAAQVAAMLVRRRVWFDTTISGTDTVFTVHLPRADTLRTTITIAHAVLAEGR